MQNCIELYLKEDTKSCRKDTKRPLYTDLLCLPKTRKHTEKALKDMKKQKHRLLFCCLLLFHYFCI
ncbi:hypothetical protein HMPREF0669_01982 (plasmid) [Prevotella sp. oral taxon 299 str. F0039]|nr:hypothetical protein HMPREF0669_01982 [Prevotella sp. oral taxon 299 str. F0039]